VLHSGCTNHLIREKKMFTSFEKNVTTYDSITFGDNSQGKVLGHGKLLSLPNIIFLKFFLLNLSTTICCPFHNFVRWATIVCSPIRV
jgi:hypothetical protein